MSRHNRCSGIGYRRMIGRTAGGMAIASALMVLGGSAAGQEAAPRRIVSLSLCADQLLVSFAAPEQIASLSRRATDPVLSYFADAAAQYPHRAYTAESVIELRPDLVLIDASTPAATRDMLLRLGYRVVEIEAVATVNDAIAQVRDVSALLGHQREGEVMAGLIETARDRAQRENWGVTAAYYHRRGFVSGETALVTDILMVAGLNNAVGNFVVGAGDFLSLEQLVAFPPDYLIVADADPKIVDQGVALLEHPALVDLFPPARRIELPERLTVCGGPSLTEAFRTLTNEFQRVTPR